jgi:hypothetical protein
MTYGLAGTSHNTKLRLDSILGKWSKGQNKEQGLQRLADIVNDTQSRLDFKQSARGWCYTLEGERIIDKGDFDRAERAINQCRKLGFLPLDFCAEDESRAFEGVEVPTRETITSYFIGYLNAALDAAEYYTPDWWAGEKFYIQMLVEKVDLKSLFRPVCEQYHIPIANASGWSDMNQRGDMAKRFAAAEKRGMECVLLYCGDFDPWGLKIEESHKSNLQEMADATGYDPSNLTIERFGLNYDFIVENRLTWIDNLRTGSDKDLTKSNYCWNCKIQHKKDVPCCRKCGRRLYAQPEFVKEYIKKYGVRKCEANALMKVPVRGRLLCKEAIERYLDRESVSRFEAKRQEIRNELDSFKQGNRLLFREMERLAREGYVT